MTDLVNSFLIGGLVAHALVHEIPLAVLGVFAICKACKKRRCEGHDTDGS
ncbi:hypothetical protein LCGC14_1733940 [marine sediment metagenome]|uniref:Uncharacterized protein n=1 Tax=marine sediment metagenome TaxID=412755 RepID=A0A0F9HWE9_9ZZZZ